jgi:nitroimidazol reductase NimA-like FMN-containing flavoprotein (pyridoxamine 5'-phosphate oxidase superfamily)
MKSEQSIRHLLNKLLSGQKLAVLCTHHAGQPYASLVAFVNSDDLRSPCLATARSNRKFANLSADSRVALLVSSSANLESDFHEAMAVVVQEMVSGILSGVWRGWRHSTSQASDRGAD